MSRGVSARLLAAFLFLPGVGDAMACSGDCDADGMVQADDLLQGVRIALGMVSSDSCASLNVAPGGVATVDKLLAAVDNAVGGCPPNLAPVVPSAPIYRTYPGYPIGYAIDASDPDGDTLRYDASDLPDGARLDTLSGVVSWTPSAVQVGPFHIHYTVTDDGAPPQSTSGTLSVAVPPLDACTHPLCDPANGCVGNLLPLTQPCCIEQPTVRVAEPLAGCPRASVLFVGRNVDGGIGRVQNCDLLRVFNFGQVGAEVRLNVEARCLNTSQLLTVHARMETNLQLHRVLFDLAKPIRMQVGNDGHIRAFTVTFPVNGPGPFFDFEGTDAILNVDLTDIDGVVVTESLRLTMTFMPVTDLPDLPDQ